MSRLLRLAAFTALCLCLILISCLILPQSLTDYLPSTIVVGWIWLLPLMVIGLVSYDVFTLIPADAEYSVSDALLMYVVRALVLPLSGWVKKRRLVRDCRRMRHVQSDYLMRLIRDNADTVYGRAHRFREIKNARDYLHQVPLMEKEDIRPFSERIGRGETDVLTRETPLMMALTSGTGGKNCLLPVMESMMHLAASLEPIVHLMVIKSFPGARQVGKRISFTCAAKEGSTEANIDIGPASLAYFKMAPKYKSRSSTTPPIDGWTCSERDAIYIHLLFGLIDKCVTEIFSGYASMMFTVMSILEQKWPSLVQDIRLGYIGDDSDIDTSIKNHFNKFLTPNPARATEINAEFQRGFTGIVKRLWPHLRVIICIDSGTNHIYGEKLRGNQCLGVPFYSAAYPATEGQIGINLWPLQEKREYLITPYTCFYEFIPIEDTDKEQPASFLSHEVVQGKTYELVLTSMTGIYRYRFGDVVTISRFYHDSPVVIYEYRIGQLLNLVNEKTSETSVYQMVKSTVALWGDCECVDYTTAVSPLVDSITGEKHALLHYVIFLEMKISKTITDEEKQQMDRSLRGISELYDTVRRNGEIDAMRLRFVQSGAFLDLREFTLNTTSACGTQYKTPRVLKRRQAVEFMLERAID